MKEIKLNKGFVACVSNRDAALVAKYNWYVFTKGAGKNVIRYAVTHVVNSHGVRTTMRMHRFILNVAKDMHVDHKDHNGLNNQRRNLRLATRSQNLGNRRLNSNNTSGVKGVSLMKETGRWRAVIHQGGKNRHLGCFDTLAAAKRAYTKAAKTVFGEFAYIPGDNDD